jgi:hypothetical protein
MHAVIDSPCKMYSTCADILVKCRDILLCGNPHHTSLGPFSRGGGWRNIGRCFSFPLVSQYYVSYTLYSPWKMLDMVSQCSQTRIAHNNKLFTRSWISFGETVNIDFIFFLVVLSMRIINIRFVLLTHVCFIRHNIHALLHGLFHRSFLYF